MRIMTKNISDCIMRTHLYTLSGGKSKTEIISKIIYVGLDIATKFVERKNRVPYIPVRGIDDTIPENNTYVWIRSNQKITISI